MEVGYPAPTQASCEAADLRRWFQSCEDPAAAQGALTWRVTQERPGTFVDISLDPKGTPLTLAADLPWQDAVTTGGSGFLPTCTASVSRIRSVGGGRPPK